MKPRKSRTASLFERSEAEWVAIKGNDRGAAFLASAPAVGIPFLVSYGALTTAEASVSRAVADGREEHPFLDAEHARRYVADLDA
ncbi:hypothetical protein OG840_03135 [Streptomyces sp. NBC_01764]|uniref:hypothetical protein n=1 Tax=Streptomyces sp. NBC_01764 TaxID=2975935 RepID=UPI00224E3340|nr:hypothetical protein [Streptomyces sp. NBC_01764]MCX4400816.1 hypothetical protein [Streptomyces sp. NBC_01764]